MQQERQVLLDYGSTLDALARHQGMVFDTTRLPHSKTSIRAAILSALDSSKTFRKHRLLRQMYLRLADFQDEVGTEPALADGSDAASNQWLQRVKTERQRLESDLQQLGISGDETAFSAGETAVPQAPAGQFGSADGVLTGSSHTASQQVVTAYGTLLDTLQPQENGAVVDASKLPFSKAAISAALLNLLGSSTDFDQRRSLKSAFIKLAYFCEGVGDSTIGTTTSEPESKRWAALVDGECKALAAELLEAGHSLDESGLEQAQQMIAAYGKLLETLALEEQGLVADESALPFPKAAIEAAITELLDSEDAPEALLQSAFVNLSYFHGGVGAAPANWSASESGGGRWSARIESERERLREALRAAGHPLEDNDEPPKESLVERAEQVVAAYGEVLGAIAPRENGLIVDASQLPASKATIKAELLRLLDQSDEPTTLRLLESAFVKLADFQEGVGENPAALESPENHELRSALEAERRDLVIELREAGHLVLTSDESGHPPS